MCCACYGRSARHNRPRSRRACRRPMPARPKLLPMPGARCSRHLPPWSGAMAFAALLSTKGAEPVPVPPKTALADADAAGPASTRVVTVVAGADRAMEEAVVKVEAPAGRAGGVRGVGGTGTRLEDREEVTEARAEVPEAMEMAEMEAAEAEQADVEQAEAAAKAAAKAGRRGRSPRRTCPKSTSHSMGDPRSCTPPCTARRSSPAPASSSKRRGGS